ncbi:MAG: SCO family protein, partial [Aquificota bacterium]
MSVFLSFLLLLLSWGSELLPDEKKTIGTYVPDVVLEDSEGRVFRIRELNRVVVLNPIYTKCTSACPLMTQGLKRAIKDLEESLVVLSLTFDPRDNPEDLRRFRQAHNLPENWYVVRSKKADSLLQAIGYRYSYNEKLGEFDHPNLYVVLTPSGKISRYLYGVNPKPRDLELAVLEAKREEVRLSPIEGFWLRCFRYN